MFGRDEGGAEYDTSTSFVNGLTLFFAAMYFVQGLGDPTSGLIAQPVRSLLKSWGESPASIAGFMALLAVPWSIKPLFALLSDYVPVFGSRRRIYLLSTSASASLGLVVLWLVPMPSGSSWMLITLLVFPTVAIAFGDVLVDALMIEHGQPRGLTGRFQSVQWGAAYIALMLTGAVAGFLSQRDLQQAAFGICALLWAGSLWLAWRYALEPAVTKAPDRPATIRRALLAPGLLAIIGIQFLWSLNPLWVSVLYLHLTDGLGFSEQVYGYTYSIFSAGCVLASLSYLWLARRIRVSTLVHLSIAAGIAANVVYWSIGTPAQAYCISLIAGWAYMTGMLIQLDLAARVVPIALAATIFALIMAITNFAASLSEALGGYCYGRLQAIWGEPGAYQGVIILSIGFAALCWLFVPALRRARPEWWEVEALPEAIAEPK